MGRVGIQEAGSQEAEARSIGPQLTRRTGFRSTRLLGRTRTLDSHASRLRRKLQTVHPGPFVVNVWRRWRPGGGGWTDVAGYGLLSQTSGSARVAGPIIAGTFRHGLGTVTGYTGSTVKIARTSCSTSSACGKSSIRKTSFARSRRVLAKPPPRGRDAPLHPAPSRSSSGCSDRARRSRSSAGRAGRAAG